MEKFKKLTVSGADMVKPDKVQKGAFGACLMEEPALVADCVAAMCEVVDVPVTVKMRIGIDTDHHTYLEAAKSASDSGVAWALRAHWRPSSDQKLCAARPSRPRCPACPWST